MRFNRYHSHHFRSSRGLSGNGTVDYGLRTTDSSGVALVITLILLSVTLVMAIAFLAISRRERNSVTIVADQTSANDAAASALALCEAQIVSQIQVTTNPYVFSLLVSTNYINQNGFTNGPPPLAANLENVNYDHYAPPGSGPLNTADFEQNVANLFYSPRVPVYFSNDFRFYLDLNRNGRYDTNGVVADMNASGNTNGLGTFSEQVGDPEWIGVLEHPDQPHGPNNRFIARYCFIAVPADSLDLNHIHNQVFDTPPSAGGGIIQVDPNTEDTYFRDQGVGTWEINLAAFLADVNTDRWGSVIGNPVNANSTYYYYQILPHDNQGIAFADARKLIAWRYGNNYNLLDSPNNMFGSSFNVPFVNNGIDNYGMEQQTTFDTNFSGYQVPNLPWAGSVNTNDFFSSPADLFDTNKTSAQFATNLVFAGVNNSTYDRYTFYRMLSQLGTDTPGDSGKLNLNYQNAVINYDFNAGDISKFGPGVTNIATSITVMPDLQTNFIQWQPHDFFTAAADKLLRAYSAEWYESSPSNYLLSYYGIVTNLTGFTNVIAGITLTNYPIFGLTNQVPTFGITNIPVYVNNTFVYTPAVNRLLQLAANMYDATTNTSTLIDSNYPSVFRPIFWVTNEYSSAYNQYFTNVYIKGYQYVYQPLNLGNNQTLNGTIFVPPVDLTDPSIMGLAPSPNTGGISTSNIWGVPWIVGAKKGLPNFNGFELESTFFIERKLQFNRQNSNPLPVGASPSSILAARNYTTNQMYVMGISNNFAAEDWNSYANNYNNQVTISMQNNLGFGFAFTNSVGGSAINNLFTTNLNYVPPYTVQTWLAKQFVMPFGTNVSVMEDLNSSPLTPLSTNNLYEYYNTPNPVAMSGYTFQGPCFVPFSINPSNYLDSGVQQLPQLNLVATNHLQAYMLDQDSSGNFHILDYVQLGSMNVSLNVNQAIADANDAGLWSTNTDYQYSAGIPYGVYKQFAVSSQGGSVPTPPDGDGGQWSTAPVPGAGNDTSPPAQQSFFSAFFSAGNEATYGLDTVSNTLLSMQAPYTPMRTVIQRFVFQANDPLVHYTSGDLNDFADDASNIVAMTTPPPGLKYLNKQSDRYMPWSTPGNFAKITYNGSPPDQNPYNLAYKDPAVYSSDNWDFPTNKYPTVGWLGRVHRGTPWQTVYLKSTNIWTLIQPVNGPFAQGQDTWQLWTGDLNADDAYNDTPFQDRLLFDLFTATPIEGVTRGQVSVNIGADSPNDMLAGLASWSALLSGTLALSNNVGNDNVLNFSPAHQDPLLGQSPPSYSFWTIQPMGSPLSAPGIPPNITGTPMWQIVEGINSTRTNNINLPGTNSLGVDGLHGVFEHVGDILGVPQLSDASPFLNSADLTQQRSGISDEMYEWIPQQILPLLTVSGTPQSPPRYVIYCYGQALRPAPNGVVQSGSFFGLCTNYQVVAESAARAVVHIQNCPTPVNPNGTPKIIVEQFNPLPPD